MDTYTETTVREHIRAACTAEGMHKVGVRLDVSQSVLSLILSGKRGISSAVAEKFGFEKKTVFVRSADEGAPANAPPYVAPAPASH